LAVARPRLRLQTLDAALAKSALTVRPIGGWKVVSDW